MERKIPSRIQLLVYLFLVLIPLLAYAGIQDNAFLTFDDADYIYENQHIQNGLTPSFLKWSFSFEEKKKLYWHPLTWMSHAVDCQLFGLNPAMHHLVNLLIHIAASLLLFRLLHRMTGDFWESAVATLLFSVHPLQVESVAWAAERKSVLSLFFTMLTFASYHRYTQSPTPVRYLAAIGLFALGLMAKPSIVIIPFLLILMDIWPLDRIETRFSKSREKSTDTGMRPQKQSLWILGLEKVPFFGLSIAAVFIATASLAQHKTTITLDMIPLSLRLKNALVAYGAYIQKLLVPTNLSVYYPFPGFVSWGAVLYSSLLLIVVSAGIFFVSRRSPAAGIGWLWFLGSLVPVSGLMQVGLWPAMADRFVYLPSIGFFILITWGAAAIAPRVLAKPRWGIGIGLCVAVAFSMVTHHQVGHWQNGISLFTQALRVGPETYLMHTNLANDLARAGRLDEALHEYEKAIALNPGAEATTLGNIGAAFMINQKPCRAAAIFKRVLMLDPDSEKAQMNMEILQRQFPSGGCD